MPQVQRRLITYCSNIHPGESWEETFAALAAYLPKVKAAVSPHHPFPVGLRLSARAAREISPRQAASFAGWLSSQDCFVPTVNAFPYGTFHGRPLKDRVYLPDWRSRERVRYTCDVATLLAGWLPEGQTGSLSTVPLGFRPHFQKSEGEGVCRDNLLETLHHLQRLWQETGREIVLSLEPEPGCLLETTADLVRLVRDLRLPPGLAPFVGICLDCCHQALQFEEAGAALELLQGAGVRPGKVQVSSALCLPHGGGEAARHLKDSPYLHQVVGRGEDGALSRYHDLPEALAQHRGIVDEWRCHCHVPLFLEEGPGYRTTRFFAEELIPLLDPRVLLEVETYTWGILPPELRCDDLAESIIREIRWVQEQCHETYRGT